MNNPKPLELKPVHLFIILLIRISVVFLFLFIASNITFISTNYTCYHLFLIGFLIKNNKIDLSFYRSLLIITLLSCMLIPFISKF
ncbi:hypothetical protein HERIO_1451 [Hepatospora eriocheir]|nr:hypothetical protein HERIO_1451 [Hepatospora eriocheir]